jgi:hypothetical protein
MEDVLVIAGQLEDVSTLIQRLRADGTLVVVFLICARARTPHTTAYGVSCKFAAKTATVHWRLWMKDGVPSW